MIDEKKFSLIFDGPEKVITSLAHQNDIPKATVHIVTSSKQKVCLEKYLKDDVLRASPSTDICQMTEVDFQSTI